MVVSMMGIPSNHPFGDFERPTVMPWSLLGNADLASPIRFLVWSKRREHTAERAPSQERALDCGLRLGAVGQYIGTSAMLGPIILQQACLETEVSSSDFL